MAHHYEHFWLDPKFWVGVAFVLFVVLTGRMLSIVGVRPPVQNPQQGIVIELTA